MRRNILLKKRIGCLLAAALVAGEIGSASMVAVAAPLAKTQTSVENQVENSQEIVDLPEEYITFGEPVASEPDVKAEELDAAKAQSQEEIQEEIPVIRPVAESETESLDAAKAAQGTDQGEVQEEIPMIFPENIPVLGGGVSPVEEEQLDMAGNSGGAAIPVDPTQPGVSEPTYEYTTVSVNDVISGSGHYGTFQELRFTFTPEKSGYYGFQGLDIQGIILYGTCNDFSDGVINPVISNQFLSDKGSVIGYFEADKQYYIFMNWSSIYSDYSYKMKWVAFDAITVSKTENNVSVRSDSVLELADGGGLYTIKVESENGYDYKLQEVGNGADFITLKNGVANTFFYTGFSKLFLVREGGLDVEDNVKITIESGPSTVYDTTKEVVEGKRSTSNKVGTGGEYLLTYTVFEYTPTESGMHLVAVENGLSINAYVYDEDTKQLIGGSVTQLGSKVGAMLDLTADTKYYIFVQLSAGNDEKKVKASIQKKDYVEQQPNTTQPYYVYSGIPLSIPAIAGKGYRVILEKSSNEAYTICSKMDTFSNLIDSSDKKIIFNGISYNGSINLLIAKNDNFEQADQIKVTVEQYEIPEIKKDVLHVNQSELDSNESYIAKMVFDKAGTYEFCGIDYSDIYSTVRLYKTEEFNGTASLRNIDNMSYYSSFNTMLNVEAGETYYVIMSATARNREEICFYLTEPSNYKIDLSQAGEDAVSCDMKIMKSAKISLTVPEAGFYELSAAGREEHYEVSSTGMDSGLALYKEQPKIVYFNAAGTYLVQISREFLAEDMKNGLDEVEFSVRMSSNVKPLKVYDGTKATEAEVNLREYGDYDWYSFTPEKDGRYEISAKWDEGVEDDEEGFFSRYTTSVYELMDDYLQYLSYSNGMYEFKAGKTYHIKVRTDYDGATGQMVLIENPVVEFTLNESVDINTYHGMLGKINIPEKGVYRFTLKSDTKISYSYGIRGNWAAFDLSEKESDSAMYYLEKGEHEFSVCVGNKKMESVGFTMMVEKVDVPEGEQEIVMNENIIWIKYVPTETQKCMVGSLNATQETGWVDFYYEKEGYLYYVDESVNYKGNDFYGLCNFVKDEIYYIKIYSDSIPNQFTFYVKPVDTVQASTFASKEVEVDACTQIDYEEKAYNGFYEVKITENTSPLTAKLQFISWEDDEEFFDGKVLEYGIGGGSEIYELGNYYSTSQLEHKTDITLYNFTGEKTSAKVELKKITPVIREIKLNEKITKTVESMVEVYTFTPSVSGYYQLDLEGISSLYLRGERGHSGKTIKSGKVNNWKAGKTYTFYVLKAAGKQISMNIKKVNNVYFYDYDQYAAFIASGGSITLMNSADVSEDLWEEVDCDYGSITSVGDDKVLVLSTKNFKNMNDRWYPVSLYRRYVNASSTNYSSIEENTKIKYEGRIYKGLYNESLKKVSASDPISNPYIAVVKYDPQFVFVQQIKLGGPTVMKVGDIATLQAVLDTMNQYAPTDATVKWSSSNSNVIAVDTNGKITANGPGTATITVKSNDKLGKSASIKIDVYQDVVYAENVSISGPQNVFVGDSIQLTATVTGKDHAVPTVDGVTWQCSDETIAIIDENGKVTGLRQGTVTITATSKDGKALGTHTVSVENIIEQKITLNESKITMKKGTKYTWLKVTFMPENTTDKSLKWQSNNKKVVTVNEKGVLSAKGIGKATITVTSANGKTAKVNVKVTKYAVKVKKVSIDSKKTIMEGEKVTIPLEVTPVNATNQKMKWKSSNEDVATVNSKGVVTAKKAGKATITVTAQDGSKKSDKCVITVKELPKVKGVNVKSNKKKTAEISWDLVEDADGYAIYMATEKNGKYKKIATTKKDVTSYTKTKLKSKKTYYFKVCAISKVGKKQYEGKLGKAMKVKVK